MNALGDQTWPQLTGGGALLMIPVGATEQHGPHLPLSTDTDIAAALVERAARERPDVCVAPAIAYGASGEHQGFPGTLSIGRQALELVLVELARSATETFARVLFVSTHGGNAAPVARAVERLRAESRDVRSWSPASGWRGDAHAGRTETSVMFALAPDQVRGADAAPGNARPVRELMPVLVTAGVAAVSANGVLGDPTGASAEEGHAALRSATAELVALVGAWIDADS